MSPVTLRLLLALTLVSLIVLAAATQIGPGKEAGKDGTDIIVGVGGGMALHHISSRFDTGAMVRVSLGYGPSHRVLIEAGARWQGCPDGCGFTVLEGGIQLRRPAQSFDPIPFPGDGRSSDRGLMGSGSGVDVGVVCRLRPPDDWGLRLEARGRRVGSGDTSGEFSMEVGHWLRPAGVWGFTGPGPGGPEEPSRGPRPGTSPTARSISAL